VTNIQQNLQQIRRSLPSDVSLVAVSKFHPIESLQEAYDSGQRIFGESREQELAQKHPALPDDIRWHFIGHLQTNKVKFIAPYVSLIETVDSLKLLREIEKQACRVGRTIDCLLELHIAEEATKYGLTLDQCRALLADGEWCSMSHVRIRGLMMMASNVDDTTQIESEFETAAQFFDEIKRAYFADNDAFSLRSWGMSHDYLLAIKHRANLVRIGTAIFGERQY